MKPAFFVDDEIVIRRAKRQPFGGKRGRITGVFQRPNGKWAYWVALQKMNTNNPVDR